MARAFIFWGDQAASSRLGGNGLAQGTVKDRIFISFESDPGAGNFKLGSTGSKDAYISKLESSGYFVWARSFGGTQLEGARSVAVDANGNVHITGLFQGTANFDPGPGNFNMTSTGFSNIYNKQTWCFWKPFVGQSG